MRRTAGRWTPSPGDDAPTVLVVGEAVVDIVEADGRVSSHVGGSPANVALGLGRLGRSVTLLTQVGHDERGAQVRAHLAASRVALHAPAASHGTSTATAHIKAGGHATYEFDIVWDTFSVPPLDPPGLVHTGSIAAFLEPGAGVVRDLLRAHQGTEITFDPNIRPALVGAAVTARRVFEETATLCTVVKMSDEDAAFLYPRRTVDEVLDRVLALGPRLAVMTRGAGEATLATEHERVRVGAVPVGVVDTIGAGDTFMASLIDSLLGLPPLDAGQLARMGREAARLASITVSRAGADLPWAREKVPIATSGSALGSGGRLVPSLDNGSSGTFLPVKEN